MVLPAESKSASMRNGVSRLEYITNPEPLQIGNDFQTRIFKEFLHMFSTESRALARVSGGGRRIGANGFRDRKRLHALGVQNQGRACPRIYSVLVNNDCGPQPL